MVKQAHEFENSVSQICPKSQQRKKKIRTRLSSIFFNLWDK